MSSHSIEKADSATCGGFTVLLSCLSLGLGVGFDISPQNRIDALGLSLCQSGELPLVYLVRGVYRCKIGSFDEGFRDEGGTELFSFFDVMVRI